ncbi:hypothetical protein LTR04_002072 [Oleoguttula sp. CCFEE 6159]|nr:hypothetical protein LTR04_002072 [Oleoguttula sp. CCFEE 6159]
MAGVPSPKNTSPSLLSNGIFTRGSFSTSTSSSPPKQAMAAEGFNGPATGGSHMYNTSPTLERNVIDRSSSSLLFMSESEPTRSNMDLKSVPTIFVRRLPRSTSPEALRGMLLFAKDLIDTEFVPSEYPEDKGFLSAIARFRTLAGAMEARERLHGKPNTMNEAEMIVEVLHGGIGGAIGPRRNTVDGTAFRQQASSAASNRQSSRYNGTFQSMPMPKLSPTPGTAGLANGDFPVPETSAHFQNLFSPQSPLSNSFGDHSRISGKSVINDDAVEDETNELLKDPLAYAKSGGQPPLPRRTTNPQLPVSRFAGLSLSMNNGTGSMASPPLSGFTSPRPIAPLQSPNAPMSPNGVNGLGPNGNYQLTPQHYQRHNYSPVNPADQNPPCNTLYVGNLPIDTSEDELKAMFSKQRGYKRLCFRTKQNGPMCFVEFEDVSFATKALNELYGQMLHNSVKGGIRLSFSKNPLGVRTGQSNSIGLSTPMTPQSLIPGLSSGIGAPPGFSTANGPPPGLAAPPGLGSSIGRNGFGGFHVTGGLTGMFGNGGFGMANHGMGNPMRSQSVSAGVATGLVGGNYGRMGGGYSDYMMGR